MARYDKTRQKNKARDIRIVKENKTNPDLAYQELADMFGLKSRQHAWYIINKNKDGSKPKS